MTIDEFRRLPPGLAKRDGSRCLLCGERIARGESIRDYALYEKVHSGCIEEAAAILPVSSTVVFALRKAFLEKRAEKSSSRVT